MFPTSLNRRACTTLSLKPQKTSLILLVVVGCLSVATLEISTTSGISSRLLGHTQIAFKRYPHFAMSGRRSQYSATFFHHRRKTAPFSYLSGNAGILGLIHYKENALVVYQVANFWGDPSLRLA